MNYFSLDKLVQDTDHFDTQVQKNFKNDSSKYNITGASWFQFCSNPVNYIIMDGDGRVCFSNSTTANNYQALFVNQQDMSSWNMWRQEGKIANTYDFVRVRWDGYSSWSATDDQYHLTFDVILVSNHRIFLYIADWPPTGHNGNCSLYYGDSSKRLTYKPSADGDKFTFIAGDENGTTWTMETGFSFTYPTMKFLIRNAEGKLYTVKDNVLTELTVDVSADVFQESGMDSIPAYSTYKELGDVELLCWEEKDIGLELTEKGQPDHLDVATPDIAVDYQMNRMWISADTSSRFQFSFDEGTTWFYYKDSAWTECTDDLTIGNTAAETHDIPMAQWQEKNTGSKIRVRCHMTSTDQYLKYIEIGNQQDYEDVYGEDCPY